MIFSPIATQFIKQLQKFAFLFFLLFNQSAWAQLKDISFPFISNYQPKEYGMHPRNFDAVQSVNGSMVFANAYGILIYDGTYWNPIALPDGISAYSLALDSQKNILVGAVGQFGFLKADNNGNLVYHSLSSKLNINPNQIGIIHKILITKEYSWFIGEKHIFQMNSNKQVKLVYESKTTINFAGIINNQLVIQTNFNQPSIFHNNHFIPLAGFENWNTQALKSIIPFSNGKYVILSNTQMFIWQNNSAQTIHNQIKSITNQGVISSAILLPENKIAIATENNGLFIINENAELISHINTQKGLRKNSINNLYLDHKNGLWMILDNGLAYTEIESPYSFLNESSGILGMGYKFEKFNGALYAATDQGLFIKTNSSPKFIQIPGIQGMVKDIVPSGNALLCANVNGIYEIKGTQVKLLYATDKNASAWTSKTFSKSGKTYAIMGMANGLDLLELKNNQWVYLHHIQGFEESSRLFEIDQLGNIWVCHGNKGMYRIVLNDNLLSVKSVENLADTYHLSNDFFNHISMVNNQLCISTAQGIFNFDFKKNKLVLEPAITKAIGGALYTERVVQTADKTVWVFMNGSLWQLSPNGKNYKIRTHHKLKGEFIGSYEFVDELNTAQYILGSQNGFILLNKKQTQSQGFNFKPLIKKVEVIGVKNKTIFNGIFTNKSGQITNNQEIINELNYSENSINISFSYPEYDRMDNIKYRYAIIKNSNDTINLKWSDWSTLTQVEYPDLREGLYHFYVQAKNAEGLKSPILSYKLSILPPWYRAWWALLIYFGISIIAIFLLTKLIIKRFKDQKEKLEQRKKEELHLLEQKILAEQLLKEKALVELKNQQLENQVLTKKSELASVATSLNQKKEFMSQLKKSITSAAEDLDAAESKLFKQIIKNIDNDLDVSDNWDVFKIHFDEANNNFIKRLSELHPKLSPSWLLLCAYIKQNKSNKEMASLLNISVAAVEKRRYRLKDKLNIESDGKLTDFLINF